MDMFQRVLFKFFLPRPYKNKLHVLWFVDACLVYVYINWFWKRNSYFLWTYAIKTFWQSKICFTEAENYKISNNCKTFDWICSQKPNRAEYKVNKTTKTSSSPIIWTLHGQYFHDTKKNLAERNRNSNNGVDLRQMTPNKNAYLK